VQQELYLKWELVNDNKVTSIQVFSVAGILLKTFTSLESANDQIINFQEYPTGNYFLEMMYSNGEQKSIQIIKK
jgi:Secretion system C-terminal sorting domain